jgi:peptide/nickel transport system substrate-binding protein
VLITSLVMVFGSGAQEKLAKKQVLQFGLEAGDAKTFAPHRASNSMDRTVADIIFNGLVRYPPGNNVKIQPDLATSWGVSKDHKVWTFHLRKGVFFHPFPGYPAGYELTSEDVVYSLKRAANPAHSAFAGEYEGMDFMAVDPYTVRITTRNPMSETLFLPKVANYTGGAIVCKKALEEKGEEWVTTHPIGTGPFMFKLYEPQQKTVLVKNKNYFRGEPILEELVVRYMSSISSREIGLRAGELDMIAGATGEKWLEKIKTFPDIKVNIFGPQDVELLFLNMTKPPFNDIKVRKAVSYAISRKEVAAFIGESLAVPIYSPSLAPPEPGALTKEEASKAGVIYEDNLKKAKQLLTEAGYPRGLKTEVFISESEASYLRPMTGIQAQLRKAGIDLVLKVVDHSSYHSLIRKDANPLVYYAPWRPNVDVMLNQFYHSRSTVVTGKKPDTNFSHYGSVDADGDGKIDSVDDLIERARWEVDSKKQIALWKEAQIKILKDVAVVPIIRQKWIMAMRSYVDLGEPCEWCWVTYACQPTERTRILAH